MRPHSINYFFGLFLTLRSSFDLFCSGPKIAYLFPLPPLIFFWRSNTLSSDQLACFWIVSAGDFKICGIWDLCEAQPG